MGEEIDNSENMPPGNVIKIENTPQKAKDFAEKNKKQIAPKSSSANLVALKSNVNKFLKFKWSGKWRSTKKITL